MSSKYRGLPDIDTAPDVFETADEPEGLLRPNDNGFSDDDIPSKSMSEAIDVAGLPKRRDAERVFGRGTRRIAKDGSKPSFRPRLPPLSRHVSSSSSETDEPSPLPRESAAARIRRLKAELAEVEKEVGSSSGSTTIAGSSSQVKRRSVSQRQSVDVVSELAGLRERLERVNSDGIALAEAKDELEGDEWTDRLARLVKADQGGSGTRHTDHEDDAQVGVKAITGVTGGQLSELDKRLAQLEDFVGPIGDGLDQNAAAPLLATLNKHDHLLALLTQPRHLDAISRRVKLLLVDLDRAAAASRRPGTAAQSQPDGSKAPTNLTLTQTEYTSLQNLFALLPRLDPLLPILSPLLARLRSLSSLHAEASDISSNLSKLAVDDKRSVEGVKELQEVVTGVEKGLEEAVLGIQKNWHSLHGRIEDLEKRLKDLEA